MSRKHSRLEKCCPARSLHRIRRSPEHRGAGFFQTLEPRRLLSTFTPAAIRAAYGFDSVPYDGTGQTIALIEAYNDSHIATDLNTFDAAYAIPGGDASNFLTVKSFGTQGDTGWALETSLDVEWAHAIAPGAKLLVVQASSSNITDLMTAVDYARSYPGVSTVSMSWGASEFAGETIFDSHFTTPAGHSPVAFFASSGDDGKGVEWPAASPNVVSVGGSSLFLNSDGTYSFESGWSGSGGGISQVESKPSYQSGVTFSSTNRTVPDVAYNADPNTGFYVYDSNYNGQAVWGTVGGTSAGAPQWAALVALANQARGSSISSSDLLTTLYNSTGLFHDVTSGSNGYSAGTGYDLVTGLGTPVANLVIAKLGGTSLINGSFEATNANGYTYDPIGTGWTFTGNAGIQANGSAFGAINAPDGTQTAFLQSSGGNPATVGQISQSISIGTAGTYTISFKAALRSYRTGTTAPQQIAVYIDGSLLNTFTPTSTTFWDTFSLSQNLTAGTHTLTFKAALATGDTTAFLDATSIALAPPVAPSTLANGSFEDTNANGYTYDPTGASWTFTGNAGIQANGSAFGAPNAPDGNQTAFLQSSMGNPATVGQISQSLAIDTAGTYTLSFKGALRSYRFGTTAPQQIALYIDGILVNTFTPSSTTSWDSFSVSQNLSAGTHTLTFQAALANGDTTAFLDAISIALAPPVAPSTLANGSFEATNANGYTYDPTGASWTFTGNAGIQANGSAFGAPNAPDGTQTAFLQSSMGNPATVGQISQTFGISSAGTFTISFRAALRSYRFGTTTPQQIAVYMDGTLLNTFTPTSTSSWDSFSVMQNLAAGTHTLSFQAAVAGGDTTAFLDGVSIS